MELITVVAIAMALVLLLGAGLLGGYTWYWIGAAVSVAVFHVYFRPLRRVDVQQTSPIATTDDVTSHSARPHTATETAVRLVLAAFWTSAACASLAICAWGEGWMFYVLLASILGVSALIAIAIREAENTTQGDGIMRIVGALVCIADAIWKTISIAVLIRAFMYAESTITYHGVTVSLLDLAPGAIVVMAILDVMSAVMRPGHWFFRWFVDFVPSLVFALLALAAAVMATWDPYQAITLQGLLVVWPVAVWGIFDSTWNQKRNIYEKFGIKAFDQLHDVESGTNAPLLEMIRALGLGQPPKIDFSFPSITDQALKDIVLAGKGPFMVINSVGAPLPSS
jgi:hypothetical protein